MCAPLGENLRFHRRAPHPGFVRLPRYPFVHVHPALSQWTSELADAFDQVAWISSWRRECAEFALEANMKFGARWPYLPSTDPSDETDLEGRGELPWGKLDAVLHWISPHQPVAFVDDGLVPQQWPFVRRPEIDRSVEIIAMRPGPILLLAPASEIGLTREMVDLLCAFAKAPHAGRFDGRAVHAMHAGRWIQWPWPLPPGQENPVTVYPANEESWEAERRMQLHERHRELHGRELGHKEVSWNE